MSINVHPGEALQEFLEDYGLSQSKLAQELRVPVRLARFFNNRPSFRLGLQELFDINETEQKLADEPDKIHPIAV